MNNAPAAKPVTNVAVAAATPAAPAVAPVVAPATAAKPIPKAPITGGADGPVTQEDRTASANEYQQAWGMDPLNVAS